MPGLRFRIRAMGAALAMASLAAWLVRPASAVSITIGQVDDFPPGSVTHLRLPVAFDDPQRPHYRASPLLDIPLASPEQVLGAVRLALRQEITPPIGRVAPVPIFVVHDETGAVRALYDRDPLTACRLDWIAAERRFEDRCSYSAYTLAGGYLRGPAPRDLDSFAVAVTGSGKLSVDMGGYRAGAARS